MSEGAGERIDFYFEYAIVQHKIKHIASAGINTTINNLAMNNEMRTLR